LFTAAGSRILLYDVRCAQYEVPHDLMLLHIGPFRAHGIELS